MITSSIAAFIATQEVKRREDEEIEWDYERSKRDAIEFHNRSNKYPNLYSCSTPSIQGSCSNNGNSFENKPMENE